LRGLKGKGEVFLKATDLLNTLVIFTEIQVSNFTTTNDNYNDMQVVRVGYGYQFYKVIPLPSPKGVKKIPNLPPCSKKSAYTFSASPSS
jgi:hypothetical protein